MLLILITGLSCTGKTTLGRRIAHEFSLPFNSLDEIKELLFDSIGWQGRSSRHLARASYALLYHFIELQLQAGQSLVVESNFDPASCSARLLQMKEQYGYEPFIIQCLTSGDVLFQRFQDRLQTRQRHPGHRDDLLYNIFKAGASTHQPYKSAPLNIGGTVLEIDTDNFASIDYMKIFAAIRARLAANRQECMTLTRVR
jgi:predicted kinase